MVFGFKKAKAKSGQPADPLAAYDGLIAELERQGAVLRRSAATLLALRGELSRDVERAGRRVAAVEARLAEARQSGGGRDAKVLEGDLKLAEAALEASRAAQHQGDDDARLLIAAAEEQAARLRELSAERSGARTRLSMGEAVTRALRERSVQIDKVLALDAARDEVERAHALAEIYREDEAKRAPGPGRGPR